VIKQIASVTVILVLFFVLLFTYVKLAGPIPFSVNSITTTKSTTFDVAGQGKASVKPDSAKVSAGISATGSASLDVKNQINATINKVSAAIKAVGVSPADIQTSNYSINPTYDYTGGTQKINGYSANTSLTVTVKDINKVNAVIDAATQAGANNVNNLGFGATDKSSAEMEARKLAVADAKKKAADIANLAGFKLGNLVNYSEGSAGSPRPIPMMAKAQSADISIPTQVEPGSEEVIIDVTLSYEVR